ncbi:MAG: ComEC family competence protein, partial [Patescibacteria group bacterium]
MSKSRIFLWGMLAFVAGVGIRSFVFVPYIVMWMVGVAAAVMFVIGVRQGSRAAWMGGLFAVALVLGVFRLDMAEYHRPDVSAWYGKNVRAEGVVWEAPRRDVVLQRMKIKIRAIDGVSLGEPFFVLAGVRPYPRYHIGDRVQFDGVLQQPENFSDFDYVSYLARDGIFLVTAFPRAEKTGEDTAWRVTVVLAAVKDAFESNIDTALPEPHAAFMKGLLLGERASLPQELVENFKVAGVSHIVALSGYNITLIGRNLMNLLLWCTAPFVISFWIAVAAIFLFVLMTGA